MNTYNYNSVHQIEKIILKHKEEKLPLSLIRFGDGEFEVIGYPKFTNEINFINRFRRWFYCSENDLDRLKILQSRISIAISRADILGLPNENEIKRYIKWKNLDQVLSNEINLGKKHIFYNYDITQINFNSILFNIKNLGIITCRDLRKSIAKKFNIKNVYHIDCPAERFNYHNTKWNSESNKKSVWYTKEKINSNIHHLDIFESNLICIVKFCERGTIFLVGAGGLGKIYCDKIKNCGGIALDIGSVFDGWDGADTRPYTKGIQCITK